MNGITDAHIFIQCARSVIPFIPSLNDQNQLSILKCSTDNIFSVTTIDLTKNNVNYMTIKSENIQLWSYSQIHRDDNHTFSHTNIYLISLKQITLWINNFI